MCSRNFKIDEFVRLVHPRDGHKKIIAVFEAYLDESGIHDGARVCVVAGYFGGPGQWKKAERAWKEISLAFGVPHFHAKELWARKGPYRGWDGKKTKRFLDGLIDAILAFRIYPVASAIMSDDFFTFSVNQRKYLTGAQVRRGRFITSGNPDRPYYVPFQKCIFTVARYVESKSRAHFFFGLGRAFSGYALEYFGQTKNHPDMPNTERMGNISFPIAQDTSPLQAADLLSYLMYQHTLERLKNDSAPIGDLLSRCLGRSRSVTDFWIFDRSALQSLLDIVKRDRPREDSGLILDG